MAQALGGTILGRFHDGINGHAQVNNHPQTEGTKIKLRRLVLDVIGASRARVFDAFAGDGVMFRGVWREAAAYVGCDLNWYRDDRPAFVADNRRLMRAIDLTRYNIFDLDAWGSPWEQALILAARRPVAKGERLGLVITEGSTFTLKMGMFPNALRSLAGLTGAPVGGGKSHDELTSRAIAGLCRRMSIEPVRRWQAQGKTGALVQYVAMVVEGTGRNA